MKIKSYNFIRVILIFTLLSMSNSLLSQYLRDSSTFIGLKDSYPKDDSQILNNYSENEKYPITIHEIFSIPEVLVSFNDKEYPFFFDFGNSGNITITTALSDSLDYIVTDTTFTYTPDGKIRGQIYSIIVPEFQTLNQSFLNESGTLSEWSVYSSIPINGLIGLKYIDKKCFTLSYPRKLLAISDYSIIPELKNSARIIYLEHYEMHPYGIHFKGRVNGQESIIYFDTGKSHSAINQSLVQEDKIVSDKSGTFYKGLIEIDIGEESFAIYYPRVRNTRRNIDSDLPVGIEVGSDILKHFLLTVDRTNNQNLLIIH